ncbi:MAG TPA: hypothetical protein VK524_25275, partial [Polyangiaceae bacterium]|nr:hypothetical protein [Polyangiaceae bacterium]
LYDLAEEAPLRMVERISFTAIALHQRSEVNLEAEPVGLKLFGYDTEDDPSDRYFESFFNLDLANGFVFWNEKDPEYRLPLLRGIADVDADSVARLRCFGRG